MWYRQLELLYQLAKVSEEIDDKETATVVLDLCLQESFVLHDQGDTDPHTAEQLEQSLIPRAQLLLAQ